MTSPFKFPWWILLSFVLVSIRSTSSSEMIQSQVNIICISLVVLIICCLNIIIVNHFQWYGLQFLHVFHYLLFVLWHTTWRCQFWVSEFSGCILYVVAEWLQVCMFPKASNTVLFACFFLFFLWVSLNHIFDISLQNHIS